jgi:hypothetical protein
MNVNNILDCIDTIVFSGYKEAITGNKILLREKNKGAKCNKGIIQKVKMP